MNKIKPTKTISGVAPLSVMVPPRRCDHGACLYCPTLNAPQSYTPKSPAVLRAISCGYDPYFQVIKRLKTLENMGHPIEKIELIVMGGTFLSFPRDFCFKFITKCYAALNDYSSKKEPRFNENSTLKQEIKKNEKAKNRCVALCIETRPDVCSDEHIKDILSWGTTRVELGVQALDDEIYKKINRCHNEKDVADATLRLKKAGFKIGYHLMPGLPGSSMSHDIKLFKKVFNNQNFRPDQIKIYPCQVLKGAGLAEFYYGGEYVPYDKEQAKTIIAKMLMLTPNYCRVMRIMREIPPEYLIAGIKNINLRKEVEEEIREKGYRVKEIRFREIGFALRDGREIKDDIGFKVTRYRASKGIEYFIEAVNKEDIIFGLIRLRLEEDKNLATVRELHVYGPTVGIGKKIKDGFQHKGLGAELLKRAEKIAKRKAKKIRVISGIGVRQYYRKFGYEVDENGIYVEKNL